MYQEIHFRLANISIYVTEKEVEEKMKKKKKKCKEYHRRKRINTVYEKQIES